MVVVNRRLFQVSFDTIRRGIGVNINTAALLCMVVGYQHISQIQNVTYTCCNSKFCRIIFLSNVGLHIDGTAIGFSSITADCTFFDGNTAVISCPNCATFITRCGVIGDSTVLHQKTRTITGQINCTAAIRCRIAVYN